MTLPGFERKAAARRHVWDLLGTAGVARFPLPPHGRIPNFAGAREAARRLFDIPFWRRVRRIKVNPDAPQRPVRELALRRGITVYMPTPRLRGGFKCLDPSSIPAARIAEAVTLAGCDRWARPVSLDELPAVDAVVCGSVAVSRDGRRCGKGEGYSDLEYAVLRELGHPPAPVATTVHPLQIVAALPRDPTDLPIRWVVTPEEVIEVREPPPPPTGVDWDRLGDRELAAMPVLKELRAGRSSGAGVRLLLAGPPGCGKTTVILRVAEALRATGRPLRGIVTEEIRSGGQRLGFSIRGLGGGASAVMAHLRRRGGPCVGRYGVHVAAVDEIVAQELEGVPPAAVVLVDEVGKMECTSRRFRQAVLALLGAPNPLVATFPARLGSGGAAEFIRRLRDDPRWERWTVTSRNRSDLPRALLQRLGQ